ncbi:MAG TPA: ABC transporter substrate-binding protein [Microlunatus sp.]|nr:ABC transporter substrate-binding protein [Microlunatus sp.]
MPSARCRAAVATIALAAALTSCSTAAPVEPPAAAAAATDYAPRVIDNCGHQVRFTERPSRVVIMNGISVAEVESFILLGLQDTIAANAQFYARSDDPGMVAEMAALPDGGVELNRNFDIPAEQLIALRPDLVISTWSGGFDPTLGFATREELFDLGINSLVNPVNCGYGKPDATPAEKAAAEDAGVASSFAFLDLLGRVFAVEDRASALIGSLRQRIADTERAVAGRRPPVGLIVFPGMSMMNANGLPAVMTGGIYDDVLRRAGVRNAFGGADRRLTASLNAEQLAAAEVELLIIGGFTRGEDLAAEAEALFRAHPDWPAARTRRYVTVADGVYLGPLNALAVERIARAAHPDAF